MDLKEFEKLEIADTNVKPRKKEIVDNKDCGNKTKAENLGENRSVVKTETKSLAKDSLKSKNELKKPHRLKVLDEIGHGAFGLVLSVEDIDTREISALKVMELEDFDPDELKILRLLKKINAHAHHCIELINSFRTKSEVYLQFPLYGPTLQSVLNRGSFILYSEDEIWQIVKQICLGVEFIHDHHIVHSDLKQDNVIFVHGNTGREVNGPKIVLIDFGQAFMDPEGTGIDSKVCCFVCRPPESHLEMFVSYPIDVWSVGLLCFLMYQGQNLLQFGSPLEMLAQMEQIFGQFPKKLRMVKAAPKYFTSSGFTKRPSDFDHTILQYVKSFQKYRESRAAYSHRLFPLMENLLKLDPGVRITMKEVIKSQNW